MSLDTSHLFLEMLPFLKKTMSSKCTPTQLCFCDVINGERLNGVVCVVYSDLGVHIDGYIALTAHTFVLNGGQPVMPFQDCVSSYPSV